MGKKKLTPEAQAAAVREQMRGSSLEAVAKQFPDLADGVEIVRREQDSASSSRDSGSGNLAWDLPPAPVL